MGTVVYEDESYGKKEENSNVPDPYTLTNYDKVFVLLQPNAGLEEKYPEYVKYDSVKKKKYITGRLVKVASDNSALRYPRVGSIALVVDQQYVDFKKAKPLQKEKYIITIFYGHIEFITLDFNSFDWK